jgi:hypothetical protein
MLAFVPGAVEMIHGNPGESELNKYPNPTNYET